MNILFSLPRQHPNQAGWYHALTKAGHTVNYLVSYSLPINERADLPEPHVVKSAPLPFWYRTVLRVYAWYTGHEVQKPYLLWPDQAALEKMIASSPPDLIIIREALTPLSLVMQRIARRHRIPTVHYSQAPLQRQDGILLILLRILKIIPRLRLSPTLDPTVSPEAPKNSFYVPLFVPAAVTEATKELTSTSLVRLLFVGKYIRRKNQLLLLRAFAEICKDHSVTLTMVGSSVISESDCPQKVFDMVHELNLSDKVTLESDIDPLQMSKLYRSHDIFVLPSVAEPFSISPLEAMAHGLPVIVTDSNGCQFHIKDGINGYVVKSNDFETLVQSLKKMVDPKHLTTLKHGALNYAKHTNNEKNFLHHFDRLIAAVKINPHYTP